MLLRVAHAGEDWPLKAAGLSGVTATGPIFEYYDHALKAASDGLGVALGIRPYIDDLRDGQHINVRNLGEFATQDQHREYSLQNR
jgi:hypothetical protein